MVLYMFIRVKAILTFLRQLKVLTGDKCEIEFSVHLFIRYDLQRGLTRSQNFLNVQFRCQNAESDADLFTDTP
jgi:hypothetical protein